MEKFDVIVVGAGPAGITAAYKLAKGGASVLLIERGPYPGSKNVSGALVFARIVERIFPRFWEQAPVERRIGGHGLVFLGEKTAVNVDSRFYHDDGEIPNAFTVHRAKFDRWMAQQAEAAGAALVTSITVDELLMEGDRVVGIKAGPDELRADVVIDAEGAKSLLLERAGLRKRFASSHLALGVKEVIELPSETIEARFNLQPGEGTALTMVGGTEGREAGGFLYTNKDSLSLGLVIRLQDLTEGEDQPHELLERYRQHPYVAKLIQGGTLGEYSAAIVHEGVLDCVPKVYGEGYLVVGSAAGLLVNNLFTFRGIDLAVESGALAADTVLEAKEAGEFSETVLSSYHRRLDESFVLKDMHTFQRASGLIENPRIVGAYPELVGDLLEYLYSVRPEVSQPIKRGVLERVRARAGLMEVLKDSISVGRAL